MEYTLSDMLVEAGAVVVVASMVLFALGRYWRILFPHTTPSIVSKVYLPVRLIDGSGLSSRFAGHAVWFSQISEEGAILNAPKGMVVENSPNDFYEVEFLSGGKNLLKKKSLISVSNFAKPSNKSKYVKVEVKSAERNETKKDSLDYISLKTLYNELTKS